MQLPDQTHAYCHRQLLRVDDLMQLLLCVCDPDLLLCACALLGVGVLSSTPANCIIFETKVRTCAHVPSSRQQRRRDWFASLRPRLVPMSKVTRLISHATLSRFCLVAVTYKSVDSTQCCDWFIASEKCYAGNEQRSRIGLYPLRLQLHARGQAQSLARAFFEARTV
jgi:hypothetical protein